MSSEAASVLLIWNPEVFGFFSDNLLDMKFFWIKGLENPKEPLENALNAKQHFEKVMPFWDM